MVVKTQYILYRLCYGQQIIFFFIHVQAVHRWSRISVYLSSEALFHLAGNENRGSLFTIRIDMQIIYITENTHRGSFLI